MTDLKAIRAAVRQEAPVLVDCVWNEISPRLIPKPEREYATRKIVADAIWQIIPLEPFEAALLDLPLVQRLRRIHQLGLSNLVYPGANHTRLEHSLGTMHVAKKMLAAFTDAIPTGRRAHYEAVISTAALLHDTGHIAFSHAGERTLKNLLAPEWQAIAKALDAALPEALLLKRIGSGFVNKPKSVKASPAELLTVLFLLSEHFSNFIAEIRPAAPITAVDIPTIIGLILGRPVDIAEKVERAVPAETRMLEFIRGIVSGDLDADKLDYVARDAHYTRIPTTADSARILFQLRPVSLDGASLELDPPISDKYWMFGLHLAGASSLEMFLASRAYLYERVYRHHKVQAAEALLDRVLNERFAGEFARDRDSATKNIINMFFSHSGSDDSVLASLDDYGKCSLTYRRLPHRALAISLEEMLDYDRRPRWAAFSAAMGDVRNHHKFEDQVKACAQVNEPVIFSYFPTTSPDQMSEDLDIWVPGAEETAASSVSPYVNLRQHVTAFTGNRLIDWLFSAHNEREKVAAAGLIVLWREYKLGVSKGGLLRSKLDVHKVHNYIKAFAQDPSHPDRETAVQVLTDVIKRHLIVTRRDVLKYFPKEYSSQEETAARIADGINACKLPASEINGFRATMEVLRFILSWCAINDRELDPFSQTGEPEQFFSNQFMVALARDSVINRVFTLAPETKIGNGYVDLKLISSDLDNGPHVVIEFKAEPKQHSTIIKNCSGQAIQYVQDGSSRIAILLFAYDQKAQVTVSDTLQVVSNQSSGSPIAVISVGVRAKGDSPRELGTVHA